MKAWLNALFSSQGDVSMMRVLSLICCLSAVSIAIVGINRPTVDYSGLTLLCSAFLTAAFGGKIAQKSIEAKSSLPK